MKVAYVCDTLPFTHHSYSGAEITCEMVSNASKKNGYNVFYITSQKDFESKENKVYSLPKSYSKNFPIDLHIAYKILMILRYEKPDIIHLYTKQYLWASLIASYLTNTKIVYSVVDYHIICPKNILLDQKGNPCLGHGIKDFGYMCSRCYYKKYPSPLNRIFAEIHIQLFKWFYKKVKLFLTFTEESKWRLTAYGIPEHKVDYFYQYSMPKEKETDIQLLLPAVVFVGSFFPHKGLDIIIKAFKKVLKIDKEVHLYIIGSGDPEYKLYILELIGSDLNKNIHLLGKIDHRETLSIMKKSNLVVVNEKWYSDFGNVVVVEALLLGKPVVCGNLGTGSIFVDEYKAGYWAYYFNPNDFARKIIKGLDFKTTGKPFMTLPKITEEIKNVYEKVIQ